MGQVLKREATTGNQLHARFRHQNGTGYCWALDPQWCPEEGHGLGLRFGPKKQRPTRVALS